MLPSRLPCRAAALLAATACLALCGCGAGSAAPPGATGGGSGSPGSTQPAVSQGSGPVSTVPVNAGSGGSVKLTGNVCTDFANLKYHVPAIPPGDSGNLPALKNDATRVLTASAAYFTALAGESPPILAGAFRTLASTYQQDIAVAQAQTSAPALEHLIKTAQFTGPALAALRVIGPYFIKHCP